jgi:hypothetical protein
MTSAKTFSLTSSDIPSQMPNTVERVESEWHSKDELCGALEPCWEIVCELDEVGRVDGGVKRVE